MSAIAGTGLLAGCLDEETSDEMETGTESDEEEEDPEGADGTGEENNGSEPDADEDAEEEPSEPTDDEPDEEDEEENESEPTEDEVNESEEANAEDGRSVTIQEARWIGGEDEDEEITVTAVVLNDGDVPLTIDLTATARTGAEGLEEGEGSETETAEEIQPGDGYDFLLSFSAPGIGDYVESGETDGLVEVEAVAYEPDDDEEPIRTATFAQYDRATAGADSLSILSLLQRLHGFF